MSSDLLSSLGQTLTGNGEHGAAAGRRLRPGRTVTVQRHAGDADRPSGPERQQPARRPVRQARYRRRRQHQPERIPDGRRSSGVDTASADNLFNKLDANDDGNISRGEWRRARGGHHHHGGRWWGGGGGISSLLNATDVTGASSQTSTNSDGSSSTTITYADGSTVTMTTRGGERRVEQRYERQHGW